ncbi:MAG: E3 ubiquitin ligase family protein [Spirochaetales bacterium]|nr:E3 ubiquitin ligase family protein [Spirochaetales bacterium]
MWYILSIALILLGIGLIIARKFQSDKLFEIKATQTFLVKDLIQEANDVKEGLGEAGSFNKLAEVKGRVVCDNPVTSELAQVKCVYYTMQITRKWEETYWDTDPNGNQVQRTREGTDTVAHNSRGVPFYVEDSTGKIKIDPSGAEMITEKAFSRFQPGELSGPSIQIGGFTLNLGSISLGSGRRTIGYEYEESIIPLNRDIYVLGEAVDTNNDLRLLKPSEKGKKFIISVKSEEDLMRGIQGAITGLLIAGLISGIGGVVLLVLRILGIIQE